MNDRNAVYGAILSTLADGKAHEVAALGAAVALSVTQLEGLFAEIQSHGVDLHYPDPAHHVTWHNPSVLLNTADLQASLGDTTRERIAALFIDTVCTSTNQRVLDAGIPRAGELHVALAEYQSAGRGRRGRVWTSPLAAGICMTVAVRCPEGREIDSALTLALGVALSDALNPLVDADVLLKWPNDLILDGHKLGGILTELIVGPDGAGVVLIGVGINVNLPADYPMDLQPQALPPAGLSSRLCEEITRVEVVARLLDKIAADVDAFWSRGFIPFMKKWNARDYLRNQPVQALAGDEMILGTAEGVNEEGALIVNVDGTRRYLNSGEVRVRAG